MAGKNLSLLIAPFTLKESLPVLKIAEVLDSQCEQTLPEFQRVVLPLADGGNDTLAVLQAISPPEKFQFEHLAVTGPLPGTKTDAAFAIALNQGLVVIEAAQAHGLVKSPFLKPLSATSFGVGELIRHAIQQLRFSHCQQKTIVVTLGGSASSDGGAGALQALGFQFLKSDGSVFSSPILIPEIRQITGILPPDGNSGIWSLENGKWALHIATDVNNPLCGEHGAAKQYAPQKGATPMEVTLIEECLQHFADCCTIFFGTDLRNQPGMGAAGGLAFGLSYLPYSCILSGFEWISAQTNLLAQIAKADMILTSEGRFDEQSLAGKGVGRLISLAQGKPVIILCGQTQEDIKVPSNVLVFPLVANKNNLSSIKEAIENPVQAIQNIFPQIAGFLWRDVI